MAKSLQQKEAKLGGELLDSLSAEASTSSIRVRFFDSDDKNTQRTPDADTLKFTIDLENTQGKKTEFITCTSHSTTNGVTTLSSVTRGLQRDATIDLTGSSTRAQQWDPGTPIGVSTEPTNENLMKAYFEGTEPVPAKMEFDGGVQMDGLIEFLDSNVTVRRDSNDLKFKDVNQSEVSLSTLAAAAGTDEKVKITINDTTNGYLNDKLTAGDGLSKTEVNDGSNETLDLDIDLTDTTIFVSTASGAGDDGKIARLNASGKIPSGFLEATLRDLPLADFSSTRVSLSNDFSTATASGGTVTQYGAGVRLATGASGNVSSASCGIDISTTYSDIASNSPKFFMRARFVQTATQDAMLGLTSFVTQRPTNNVLTSDHAAFLIEDSAIVASVADGTTQSTSSDLSGTYPIDTLHEYYIAESGGNYLFYIDGNLVHTSSGNEPDNSITSSSLAIITRAAASKTVDVFQHSLSFDE